MRHELSTNYSLVITSIYNLQERRRIKKAENQEKEKEKR